MRTKISLLNFILLVIISSCNKEKTDTISIENVNLIPMNEEVVLKQQRVVIKDGKIILNVSQSAAHNLKLTNSSVSFRARFSGVPFDVWVPVASVLGIYAKETGQGMIFSHGAEQPEPPDGSEKDTSQRSDRSHLKVVK